MGVVPATLSSLAMADDLLGDLLSLEDGFYDEGFQAGVADSARAGHLEGKVFGIEKGYDKALELGKLNGRAYVWKYRQQDAKRVATDEPLRAGSDDVTRSSSPIGEAFNAMTSLPKNSRLDKHVDGILALTDPDKVSTDNSDESVSQFEDSVAKAKAKAKMVAIAASEPLEAGSGPAASIEDSAGL